MESLYDKLIAYDETDAYPFHMPGHKRHLRGDILNEISRIDITEIDDFDNLHDACGILKEAQERAAELYGAEESFFLVNGSTGGILSAVSACVPQGGWLMMARNCHKSVYHAAMLRNLRTEYIYPKKEEGFSFCSGLTAGQVKRALDTFEAEHPGETISALVLTSPTYEGVFSDIQKIVQLLHARGIPLIVDEAHGAHLKSNSCYFGADLVIHSLHKTMTAMTQTAILHVNGTLVDRQKLRRYLSVYQTSSPSYVLMASIDRAVTFLSQKGGQYWIEFLTQRRQLLAAIKNCRSIRIYRNPEADICKLVLSVRGTDWTGKQLYDCLRLKYGLQLEMAAGDYVIAILTMMDSEEGFQRLAQAILEIDEQIGQPLEQDTTLSMNSTKTKQGVERNRRKSPYIKAKVQYTIAQALELPAVQVLPREAEGRISAEFVYVYPPGIPLLAPGEQICRAHLKEIERIQSQKLDLKGMREGFLTVLQ